MEDGRWNSAAILHPPSSIFYPPSASMLRPLCDLCDLCDLCVEFPASRSDVKSAGPAVTSFALRKTFVVGWPGSYDNPPH